MQVGLRSANPTYELNYDFNDEMIGLKIMQIQRITLNEAKIRLDELLAMAILGNDVIITGEDGTSFRIVPFDQPYPKFGSAKGLIEISDDFDEPVEGFEEYMP